MHIIIKYKEFIFTDNLATWSFPSVNNHFDYVTR